MRYRFPIVALGLWLLAAIYPGNTGAISVSGWDIDKKVATTIESKQLKKEINLSAAFLIKQCRKNGKFLYRINMNPGIAPIPGKKDLLAVWSKPEISRSAKPLQAAAISMASLARQRKGKKLVEADHWALLAPAKLLPLYDRCRPPLPKAAIDRHAVQICESILKSLPLRYDNSIRYGGFTEDGRTTPTAIRLEGLLAAFSFLDGIRLSLSGKEKWGRDLISACRQIKPDPNFFSHQCDTNITWS